MNKKQEPKMLKQYDSYTGVVEWSKCLWCGVLANFDFDCDCEKEEEK